MKELIYIFSRILLLIMLLKQSIADTDPWNKNHELRDKLLKNYDKSALPQRDVNGTTTVHVNLVLRGLWINDDEQILVVNSWMAMVWKDDRLKWDEKDYGGLKMAHFGDSELWKPDVSVFNNAKISEVDHYGNIHLLVTSAGFVMWVPPAHYEVNCPIDLKFWPFDLQHCEVRVGSWTSHGWQINFEVAGNRSEISTTALTTKYNNWIIVKGLQKRNVYTFEGYDEPYIDITYTFDLKRYSPTFAATVVIPAIAIPIFMMLQFVLPVDHPKRLSIGCSCTLLVLLELLFLKFSLPKLGTSVPLIVSYYSQSFILVVLTVAISAGLGRLAHPQNPLVAYPPPELLKRFMTGIPATVLCLRNHANKVGLSGKMAEDGEILDASKEPSYAHEWLFMAKAADRIAVIFFIVLYVFSLIGYVSPIK